MSASPATTETHGILVRRDPWYRHPMFVWVLKATAINFILPFFNGVMLGFGEIFANEFMYKYGWFGFSRPALGINGVHPNATREYKTTIQTEVKREQQQLQNEGVLLLD
ncbi:outer membrane protein TOM13-domain-containing protein [Mycotypha africana]|uniref:outer membrane protein TOM13-domain-containing protein n=1 Tax=Mycotypha africana TaxID=64632 RepID=UPI002300EE7F|nr:outer membrane protein TOM13-domain-containing protein [Mycotypha africana]KAI8990867.1 outer membrane protein TOM13-domain-containing protein [Mycotypha africana]